MTDNNFTAEKMNELKKNDNSKNKKFMFLSLGENQYAVSLSAVREVLGLGQLSALPNMPSYFAGLINLRGKIISAVYLKKSLHFLGNQDKDHKSRRPCVVITEINGKLFGAIADDVVEVAAIADTSIDYMVDGLVGKEVFSGVIKRQGELLAPILNLEKALKLDELVPLTMRNAA